MYDGHDKTFFFFNFEQFRETVITNNIPKTVPTLNYRNGNFLQALTGRVLGTDPFGRQLLENTIYDPNTDRLVNGLRERDPFPNNTIPLAQIDPVALKVQAFMPLPTSSALVNNYLPIYSNAKVSDIPSRQDRSGTGPQGEALRILVAHRRHHAQRRRPAHAYHHLPGDQPHHQHYPDQFRLHSGADPVAAFGRRTHRYPQRSSGDAISTPCRSA